MKLGGGEGGKGGGREATCPNPPPRSISGTWQMFLVRGDANGGL